MQTAARPACQQARFYAPAAVWLPGCEADFVILNPQATPLLARKTARADTLDELLFALIALGDDRLIEKTVISQAFAS